MYNKILGNNKLFLVGGFSKDMEDLKKMRKGIKKHMFLEKIISILFFCLFLALSIDAINNKREFNNNYQAVNLLSDTQKSIAKIAIQLHGSLKTLGYMKYSSHSRWVYYGGIIDLDGQCIEYDKLNNAIKKSGFSNASSWTNNDYCIGDVYLYITKVSRENNNLICDYIYFDYSWEEEINKNNVLCNKIQN